MTGSLGRLRRRPALAGARARRAWLVLRARGHEVVEFDGPVLELMTEARTRFDQRLAALGPDILAEEFDEQRFLRPPARGRPDARRSATRCSTSARSRASATSGRPRAAGTPQLDPWRPTRHVSDDEALAVVARCARGCASRPRPGCRPATARSTIYDAPAARARAAGRGSAPAARATTTARPTGARDASASAARAPLRRVGHKGADLIAPGNTLASFDAALAAGVDMIEFDVLPERDGRPAAPRPRLRGSPPSARRSRSSEGARPSRLARLRRHRARRRPQAPRLRGARGRRAARARARRAQRWSRRSTRESLAAVRARRAGAAPRLVGPQGRSATTRARSLYELPALVALEVYRRVLPRPRAPRRSAPAAATRSWPTGALVTAPLVRAVRRRRRRALRVDGRRRGAASAALEAMGVDRRDHQRSAAVRLAGRRRPPRRLAPRRRRRPRAAAAHADRARVPPSPRDPGPSGRRSRSASGAGRSRRRACPRRHWKSTARAAAASARGRDLERERVARLDRRLPVPTDSQPESPPAPAGFQTWRPSRSTRSGSASTARAAPRRGGAGLQRRGASTRADRPSAAWPAGRRRSPVGPQIALQRRTGRVGRVRRGGQRRKPGHEGAAAGHGEPRSGIARAP